MKGVIETEATEYHVNGTVSVSDAKNLLIIFSEYSSL
jgi:hypothetical protein